MSKITVSWCNPVEGQAWADQLRLELVRPCVVLLSGPLGAGKTELVRWLLAPYQISVSSPTFTILQEYTGQSTGGVPFYADHVDLYRVRTEADLESTGFWDLFMQPEHLVFVEWADRLPTSAWPSHGRRIFVEFTKVHNESRELNVEIVPPGILRQES